MSTSTGAEVYYNCAGIVRPLPSTAIGLCEKLKAPPRLVAHLALVHDVALELLDAIAAQWPSVRADRDAVAFGAGTHDLGKTACLGEIMEPGDEHAARGPAILEALGVPSNLARFARTHSAWRTEGVALEDLLVALADNIWKGSRYEPLETEVARRLAVLTGTEQWRILMGLDAILERIAAGADECLAWQRSQQPR